MSVSVTKTVRSKNAVATTSVAAASNAKKYDDFMKTHLKKKDAQDAREITNTRVGSKELNVFGGSYHISADEYESWLEKHYYPVVVAGQREEYLTEKQLDKGPILVDVDMRFALSQTARLYNADHITELVDGYLGIFRQVYQFDETTRFPVYVYEKTATRQMQQNELTKDGVHLIFGISATRATQCAIRKKIIEYVSTESQLWTTLKSNMLEKWSWEDVFDEGIAKGHTNWQLVGSTKPGYEAYRLTRVFDIGYSADDEEYVIDEISLPEYDVAKNFTKMSARYSRHLDPFMRAEFIAKEGGAKEPAKLKTSSSGTLLYSSHGTNNMHVIQAKSRADLEAIVQQLLSTLTPGEFNLREAYEYAMCLPEKYYGTGSYDKWIRVGWALKNVDDRLFAVWALFSAQSPSFDYTGLRDQLDRWNGFYLDNPALNTNEKPAGLTKRSLMHWAKQDAYDKYRVILEQSVDQKIDNTLDSVMMNAALEQTGNKTVGCGDYDIATVLHQMYKDQFVCVSVKKSVWYTYRENRWKLSDDGTELRNAISEDLRTAYLRKAHQIMEAQTRLPEGDEMAQRLEARCKRVLDIYRKLGDTHPKDNIMKEAKELFYDGQFFEMVDTNPYILVFKNGVWDFREKVFRGGKPEDYVSKSTNNRYVPLTDANRATQNEIHDFMSKLYPDESLREYMWDHLSSTLIGVAVTQTFHNYIGVGRNGKSVLVSLMGQSLGEYKHEVNIKLVTCKERPGVGGVTPEIVELKGVRYAVMQEPSKGEKINEGPMKMMTSGVDNMQGRVPFGIQTVTFKPQFKLVVCANYFLSIETQDEGTWRRIRVAPHEALFTENPVQGDPAKPYQFLVDPTLEEEKFPRWKEIFLSMLVERVLQTGGKLRECARVLEASNEYRRGQDVIAEFINARIVVSKGDWLKKTLLNREFTEWHISNYGSKGPKSKEVHAYLDKQFGAYENKGWANLKCRMDAVDEDDDNEIDTDEPMFA